MKTRKSPLRYTEESDWTLKRERSKEVGGKDDVKKKSVVKVCGLYRGFSLLTLQGRALTVRCMRIGRAREVQ